MSEGVWWGCPRSVVSISIVTGRFRSQTKQRIGFSYRDYRLQNPVRFPSLMVTDHSLDKPRPFLRTPLHFDVTHHSTGVPHTRASWGSQISYPVDGDGTRRRGHEGRRVKRRYLQWKDGRYNLQWEGVTSISLLCLRKEILGDVWHKSVPDQHTVPVT